VRSPAVTVIRAAVATALAAAAGVRPGSLRGGARVGAAAAAAVGAGVAVGTLLPPVRAGMATRALPEKHWRWLLFDIPIGTVWTEELLFRGAVTAVAGPRASAVAFGLWHVGDARAAGDPVPGTVLVTGVAGAVFGLLAERSGSVLAPMLAHLAVNEAGAVAAWAVQRQGLIVGSPTCRPQT
jgi:uncharacterized protein